MDITVIIGVILGFVMMLYGIISGTGDFEAFLNFPAILITFGGAISAAITASKKNVVFGIFGVIMRAIKEPKIDYIGNLRTLVTFSEKARREGLLSLEGNLEEIQDPFLKKAVQLVVDGTEPEVLKNMMEIEIDMVTTEMMDEKAFFDSLGTFGPAFGMIGTLIGLIQMLRNLNNPETLGPAMAVALITTLYGSILANVIGIPIAEKISRRTADVELSKRMILEGVVSIQAGENPRVLEEKLKSYLPSTEKTKYEAQIQGAGA
ncbi:MAG TPA: motility protein A [Fervidobacterium sp.]|nr:motility protein A [Fervidobacterium sp.]HPT53629.1 motility protein A [Fervidobacterium sp.]HPZ18173.1 motility protein A [Fervidobacterium sp.]HQE48085.1 motility protein A [Fervidobacterium sp.]HUM41753.1 motility protein A [Fervidobacterium sp.]